MTRTFMAIAAAAALGFAWTQWPGDAPPPLKEAIAAALAAQPGVLEEIERARVDGRPALLFSIIDADGAEVELLLDAQTLAALTPSRGYALIGEEGPD